MAKEIKKSENNGVKLDCFAYISATEKRKERCGALKDFYNKENEQRCKNCPFYKPKKL